MLKPTVIGKSTVGNSSFHNKKKNLFEEYNINLHKEYYDIINYLDKVSI